MWLPRNGSFAANTLLVTGGVVIGAMIAWSVHESQTISSNRASGEGGSQLPVRVTALNSARAGDSLSTVQRLDAAQSEQNRSRRMQAFREAGAIAASGDILLGFQDGLDIESERDRLAYHLGLMGEWAETDPEAALNHAKASFEPGLLQSESIGIAINKWAELNPHDAWLWADQNLTGPLKERALTDLMIGWTRRSPETAAGWLTGTGLTSQGLYNALSRTYAEQFPREAYNWAFNLPDGIFKDTAQVAIAGEWARQNPEEAANAFVSELDGSNGSNLAISITDVWGTTNPVETARWIEKLPPGDARDVAAGALATIWGASDIDSAVAWSAQIEDPSMRRQTISHLGTTWGAIEPDRALDWLGSLPPDEAGDGISGAFSSWAATDPVGLQDWISTSGGGELADQGRLRLGEVYTATNMESAMDLAMQMSTEAGRDRAVGRFFREWRRTDDASAQEWIQASWNSLPSSTQGRLATEQALPIVPR